LPNYDLFEANIANVARSGVHDKKNVGPTAWPKVVRFWETAPFWKWENTCELFSLIHNSLKPLFQLVKNSWVSAVNCGSQKWPHIWE
jgi:hypothetical protein